MKFLVDAQLPRRLVFCLRGAGHDPLHTLDLPHGNRTPDAEILALAARDGRIVVTKNADFVDSFLLSHAPPKLLLISTGNIRNSELEALFVAELYQVHMHWCENRPSSIQAAGDVGASETV
jgi:predicted nuclease of predicted toxin-antitoxin system